MFDANIPTYPAAKIPPQVLGNWWPTCKKGDEGKVSQMKVLDINEDGGERCFTVLWLAEDDLDATSNVELVEGVHFWWVGAAAFSGGFLPFKAKADADKKLAAQKTADGG